ncbi:hypothetical protein LTR64_000689 [Lithohypha guttulata]|uniref:uncharacterized protein n=1 Tax=Lithohypha guttulata TaxID=1690604 RepID=UPI002DDF8737|nr:hypothetical protein LTR51_005543 [Lithohypha guttulata]
MSSEGHFPATPEGKGKEREKPSDMIAEDVVQPPEVDLPITRPLRLGDIPSLKQPHVEDLIIDEVMEQAVQRRILDEAVPYDLLTRSSSVGLLPTRQALSTFQRHRPRFPFNSAQIPAMNEVWRRPVTSSHYRRREDVRIPHDLDSRVESGVMNDQELMKHVRKQYSADIIRRSRSSSSARYCSVRQYENPGEGASLQDRNWYRTGNYGESYVENDLDEEDMDLKTDAIIAGVLASQLENQEAEEDVEDMEDEGGDPPSHTGWHEVEDRIPDTVAEDRDSREDIRGEQGRITRNGLMSMECGRRRTRSTGW